MIVFVAEVFEEGAVDVVGAAAGGDCDDATASAAEFGGDGVGDDGEFLDGVDDGLVAGVLDADVVFGDDDGGAVDGDFAGCVAAAGDPGSGAAAGYDAGSESSEAEGIAAVEGEVHHRLVGDDSGDGGSGGSELGAGGADFDGGGDFADF